MRTDHPVYRQDLAAVRAAAPSLEPLRGRTVLITGATGLVGAFLTDALALASREEGLELKLVAVSRDAERARARFAEWDSVRAISMDLTRPGKLPEADFIVHAAANAHPAAFSADPVGTMLGNFEGVRALLEQLRAQGHGRLLFLSTGEIYGENPSILEGFSEGDFGKIDPMNPRSCYPESKRAAETLCASYVRQYAVDAVAARLCYTYGPTVTPGNSRADAQFLRRALAGEDVVLKSAGSQVRSYCYAADAAGALLSILLSGASGEAYNVANRGSVASIREYAETLARLAGVRVTFDLPTDAERQGYSVVTRAVQRPDKLEALGWRPRFSLEEGLEHTLKILSGEALK